MTTFNELCVECRVTLIEQEQLAWMLAMHRAWKTFEELRIAPSKRRAYASFPVIALETEFNP
jgi:hypothetical protein